MSDISRIFGSNQFLGGSQSDVSAFTEGTFRQILTTTNGSEMSRQLRALVQQISPQEAQALMQKLSDPNDYLNELGRNVLYGAPGADFWAALTARAAGMALPVSTTGTPPAGPGTDPLHPAGILPSGGGGPLPPVAMAIRPGIRSSTRNAGTL